jgi:hypothetical protein
MTHVQHRIMRTYEVHLSDGACEAVNLSYQLNDHLDAISDDGRVVPPESIQARIEVMKRLRKLAERGRSSVTPQQIESTDWCIEMVRTSFVEVALDDEGHPIPHYGR